MRIFMGIVWFIVCFVVLYIAYAIVLGVVLTSAHHVAGYQEGLQAGQAFANEHAVLLSIVRWAIFIAAILFAVIGTFKGVLPGTRKKLSATAPE